MDDAGWVSVKDKLPDFDVKVLTFRQWKSRIKNNKDEIVQMMDTGYLEDSIISRNGTRAEWHIGDDYNVDDVTHWMPLPSPPQL